MSPFTGDAKILEHVLRNDGGIWKEMSGTIQSIRIFDRTEINPATQRSAFSVEIRTDESIVGGLNSKKPKTCVGTFRVNATWLFMNLKNVSVKKIELNCE